MDDKVNLGNCHLSKDEGYSLFSTCLNISEDKWTGI